MKRRLIAWMLAVCAAGWPALLLAQNASDTASQTTPLRFRRDLPGDSKPITFDADHIALWPDPNTKGGVVLLMRGTVLVQQDAVRVRAQQAVVWIETTQPGVKRFTIYAEGAVRLENGPEASESASGLLEFNTHGEPTVRAHQPPIVHQSMADDPLIGRALALRNGQMPTTPPVVQQVRYEEKATEPPAEPRTPVQTVQIVPPAAPPVAPPPGGSLPIVPGPNVPPPLPPPDKAAPGPILPPIGALEAPVQRLSVRPRSALGFQARRLDPDPTDPGRSRAIITGGAIITVRGDAGVGLVDIEADRVVIWSRGVQVDQLTAPTTPLPENQPGREIEFYLAGNVELRQQGPKDARTLRAMKCTTMCNATSPSR